MNYSQIADRLEATCAHAGLSVRCRGGIRTLRAMHYELIGAPVASIARLSDELALAIGKPRVMVRAAGDVVIVEVPG